MVRDNLETLYGAINDGALDVKVSKHARQELEAYLDGGLLCRSFHGFAQAKMFFRSWFGMPRMSSPKLVTLSSKY